MPILDVVKKVKLKKRWWLIGTSPMRSMGLRGTCGTPDKSGPGLLIVSSHLRKTKMFRVAAIHEALHAAFPQLKEKEVERGAFFIDKVLKAFKA